MDQHHRHEEDTLLSRADLGHPIFTNLPLRGWIAAELVRLHMLVAEPIPPGEPSNYSDDLSVESQLELRNADPLAYFNRLSPPMRAAVAKAIETHTHHSSCMKGVSWVETLIDHRLNCGPLDHASMELRNTSLIHCIGKGIGNSPLTHDELRMIHYWDACRLICEPQPQSFAIPSIDEPIIDAAQDIPDDRDLLIPLDSLQENHGSRAWLYHMMSWVVLDKMFEPSKERNNLHAAWESIVWDGAGSAKFTQMANERFAACPWAQMINNQSISPEQTDKVIESYLSSRKPEARMKHKWKPINPRDRDER